MVEQGSPFICRQLQQLSFQDCAEPNYFPFQKGGERSGFTLLSVSLDDAKDKEKWLAAIKKDELPWQQVCDLKVRNNEVAKLYGIKGIPQSVLVGPDGMIVAKNLRGMMFACR